jgi:PAS domain S-box-containing protein
VRRRPGGGAPIPPAGRRRVLALSAGLAATGVAAGVVAGDLPHPKPSWAVASTLSVLLTLAAFLIVRFQDGQDADAIDLFEAVLAPALYALSGPVVVALAGASLLGSNALRRNRPLKALFNATQGMAAAGAGALVTGALRGGPGLTARTVWALVAGLVAVTVVNHLSVAAALALARGEAPGRVLRSLRPVIVPGWLVGWAVNTAFGLLFTVAFAGAPWTLALASAPLVVLHLAYRGHAAALADRARLAGLHRATRALARPPDAHEALPTFLEEVRACFRAAAADLVLEAPLARVVHRASAAAPPTRHEASRGEITLASVLLERGQAGRVTASSADPVAATLLALEGHRECLAAPLVDGDRSLGILCVYDPGGAEGFEEGELAVLDALAGEAARAIARASLLDEILEERQKLADIVERTSDGILTLSPGGAIRTWNPALERITGYAARDMVGSRPFEKLRPRDASGRAVWLEGWADDPAPIPTEIEVTGRSGESRWLSCSATRVADAEGRPAMLILVARDATEAHELERLKDDFVATVSHELRTPLTPIKGWAATLLEVGRALTEEQRGEAARAILRHAERLERLIANILEVSRIDRGILERRDGVVDVVAVADRVVRDARSAGAAHPITLAASGTAVRARGDEVWVEQILANLVSNARKYTPPGTPIDVSVTARAGAVELAVRDRGPGIPVAERERVFERFQRLGDHLTRSQSGTGLGLYIARQLARAVGGELAVEDTPGGGATFMLRLRPADETVPVAS